MFMRVLVRYVQSSIKLVKENLDEIWISEKPEKSKKVLYVKMIQSQESLDDNSD